MKKILIVLTLLLVSMSYNSFAQEPDEIAAAKVSSDFKMNIVKINLPALAVRNFSFQYERGLTEDISVALGVRFMPKGDLPLKNVAKSVMDKDEDNKAFEDFLNNSKISNWAITPEFRYYFGKKPLSGFYLAPYLRFGGFNISWPMTYEDDNIEKEVLLKGTAKTFSGGLLLGAQWNLGEHMVLDWWIAGPAFGSMNVTLEAQTNLSDISAQARQDLEENLDIELFGNQVETDINDNGITAKVKTPFGGMRTGLCIGFRF